MQEREIRNFPVCVTGHPRQATRGNTIPWLNCMHEGKSYQYAVTKDVINWYYLKM